MRTRPDLGCAGLEEPVKAEAPVVPNGSLELVPLPIAQLVHLAQNEAILLLCVCFPFVGTVLQLQLLHYEQPVDVIYILGVQAHLGCHSSSTLHLLLAKLEEVKQVCGLSQHR